MSRDVFSDVQTWVFDLDNTLYPPSAGLFDLIDVRMTAWIMDELNIDKAKADKLRVDYWRTYGTTLTGLMREHGVDPAGYLEHVHDISMHTLTPDPALAQTIRALPGRRIVYTNGCGPYAERVLAARGLSGLFDAVYGVEHAGFLPKPEQAAFETIFAMDGLNPKTSAMFEDDARNLAAPHAMGMRTVHVAPTRDPGAHVQHHTDDLHGFLNQLLN